MDQVAARCLNRTSVGLKHPSDRVGELLLRRLNRTSVGLKHVQRALGYSITGEPQSNQRGIETRCGRSFLSEEVRDGTLYTVPKLWEHG